MVLTIDFYKQTCFFIIIGICYLLIQVSSIPVQSCSVYMTCATCVTTLDPMDCGWCEDHCTTKETCHSGFSWSKTTCPPVLETVSKSRSCYAIAYNCLCHELLCSLR